MLKSKIIEKLFSIPTLDILMYQILFGDYGAKYFVESKMWSTAIYLLFYEWIFA